MGSGLKLPVGIDSFEKIRKNGYYYVDKTKLIEQLVENGSEVTLFTRPRRFGKTLNMSMLRSFLRPEHLPRHTTQHGQRKEYHTGGQRGTDN